MRDTVAQFQIAPTAAPAGSCDAELDALCDADRRQGLFACAACAGANVQKLHAADCSEPHIEAFCHNKTSCGALDGACAGAKAKGPFQCAMCVGVARSQGKLNASACTLAAEEAFCNGGGYSTCKPCGSAATCCDPTASPIQACPDGSRCCDCGAASCACAAPLPPPPTPQPQPTSAAAS